MISTIAISFVSLITATAAATAAVITTTTATCLTIKLNSIV
jgi:hypothetical protein